jgi:hypothetical protein
MLCRRRAAQFSRYAIDRGLATITPYVAYHTSQRAKLPIRLIWKPLNVFIAHCRRRFFFRIHRFDKRWLNQYFSVSSRLLTIATSKSTISGGGDPQSHSCSRSRTLFAGSKNTVITFTVRTPVEI